MGKSFMETVLIKEVAEILSLSEHDVERDSLKTFLETRLRTLLAEKLSLTRRYGVSNIDEMESFYAQQKLSEKDSWEDFFELSHIEAEIAAVKKALQKI